MSLDLGIPIRQVVLPQTRRKVVQEERSDEEFSVGQNGVVLLQFEKEEWWLLDNQQEKRRKRQQTISIINTPGPLDPSPPSRARRPLPACRRLCCCCCCSFFKFKHHKLTPLAIISTVSNDKTTSNTPLIISTMAMTVHLDAHAGSDAFFDLLDSVLPGIERENAPDYDKVASLRRLPEARRRLEVILSMISDEHGRRRFYESFNGFTLHETVWDPSEVRGTSK